MVAKDNKNKKAPAEHPTYGVMVVAAVKALKNRKGSTKQAIVRFINTNYKVKGNTNLHIKQAMVRLISKGAIEATTFGGAGLNGRFKIKPAPAETKKPKSKKPASKTAKSSPKKKAVKSKAAKTSPKKKSSVKKATKSPAKKTKAAKSKKQAKSPAKKTTKPKPKAQCPHKTPPSKTKCPHKKTKGQKSKKSAKKTKQQKK